MRFEHQKGARLKKKSGGLVSKLLLLGAIAGIIGGGYLLILVLTPNIAPVVAPMKKIDPKTLPAPKEDRVYITKIGVNIPIKTGGPEALNGGSWHRFPERGDPEEGGNFILSAHRFEIGLTPGETRRKSPFYHIDKLNQGDQILVDFKGTRYAYEINNHKEVKPTQTEIEAPLKQGEEPKLTLYTCTLKGESDGREVYTAKLIGKVSDGTVERLDSN